MAPERAQFRFIHADGEPRWVELTSSVISWDGGPAILSFVRDVTDVVSNRQKLARSEELLRIQNDGSPIPVYSWRYSDGDFILIDLNRAAAAFNCSNAETRPGIRASEFFDRNCNFLDDLHNTYKNKTSLEREESYTFPDGAERILHNRFTYVPPDVVYLYVEDKTDERRVERELLSIAEVERERIAIELHDHVNHDLLALSIKARLLAQDLSELSPDNAHAALEIEQESNLLISRIRSVARGLFPFKEGEIELPEMIHDLCGRLKDSFSIKCDVHISANFALYTISIIRNIYAIVQEAVMNAARHARAENISVDIREEDGALLVSVKDDGAGFSRSDEDRGGMGLEILRYRARLINGRITIESDKSRGTSVILTLPLPRRD